MRLLAGVFKANYRSFCQPTLFNASRCWLQMLLACFFNEFGHAFKCSTKVILLSLIILANV